MSGFLIETRMRKKQFFERDLSLEFGGSLLVGKRHATRPLSAKHPTHLVLKALNQWLLLRNRKLVGQVFLKYSRKFDIPLYLLGVHSDHTHASVRTKSRARYNAFVRAVTAELVRLIPGLRWALRPYTRIGQWGRDFRNVLRYIRRNILEGDFLFAADDLVASFRRSALNLFKGTG